MQGKRRADRVQTTVLPMIGQNSCSSAAREGFTRNAGSSAVRAKVVEQDLEARGIDPPLLFRGQRAPRIVREPDREVVPIVHLDLVPGRCLEPPEVLILAKVSIRKGAAFRCIRVHALQDRTGRRLRESFDLLQRRRFQTGNRFVQDEANNAVSNRNFRDFGEKLLDLTHRFLL